MHPNLTCSQYANAFQEIYQERLLESPHDPLNRSVLKAAGKTASLLELIEVWTTIGNECGDAIVSEVLASSHPNYSRLMDLPLKDMMKSMALEAACREWSGPPEKFTLLLERLFQTADVREQQLIVLVLPLLKLPGRFVHIASEATRTNIVPVFSSLALQNPFPAVHFSENQWNQMVLKTVFVGCDITEIVGMHERHNPALAETVFQYVSERQSANRTVPRAVVELCEKGLGEASQLQLNAIRPELLLE